MKIVELKCKKCKAEYETLATVPRDNLKCPACGAADFDFKETNREFKGCSGGCDSCSSCS